MRLPAPLHLLALLVVSSLAGCRSCLDRLPHAIAQADHLVYAAPDLDAAVDRLEAQLGVRAVPGGAHPGLGTRNALLAIGPSVYLEIIGPDPDQPAPDGPRIFGIDDLVEPRLVAWAVRLESVDELADDAEEKGIPIGGVTRGSRLEPDGTELTWMVTDPHVVLDDGLVPFFIQWLSPRHPATTSPSAGTLISFKAQHPEPERVTETLQALRVGLEVEWAKTPALIATIRTPHGTVELR